MNLFKSERDGEYRFCRSCYTKGYEFDYCWHPATSEEWPISGGRLWFGRCKACANELSAGKRGFVPNTLAA